MTTRSQIPLGLNDRLDLQLQRSYFKAAYEQLKKARLALVDHEQRWCISERLKGYGERKA